MRLPKLTDLPRHFRAMLLFARTQAWFDPVEWSQADAEGLELFLRTPAGSHFKRVLKNLVLRQQARALTKTGALEYEAGFATGQAATVAAIESLLPRQIISEEGDTDADPSTTTEASTNG